MTHHTDGWGDGRNIDPATGILEGEGSGQRVPADRTAEGAPPYDVWERIPTREDDPSYYDRPVIKAPRWIWAVPAYFYVGGTAGAAAVLGAAAQVSDRDGLRGLVARARRIAAVGTALGAALLVYDLGRPERFANMLRTFRPTSPMNLGSWLLAAGGPVTGASALLSDRDRGLLSSVGDAAGAAAGITGLPMAGYTAVLLTNTAVPVWRGTRRSLPWLFVASSVSGAASLLDLGALARREEQVVRRFGTAGKIAELAAMTAVEREAGSVERVGRPLHEGVSGALWRGSKALTAASLALSVVAGRSRGMRVVAGLLGTAGAVALRFAVFHAGKASARDPRATFHQQRAGLGAAAITDRAAVAGPGGRRAAAPA